MIIGWQFSTNQQRSDRRVMALNEAKQVLSQWDNQGNIVVRYDIDMLLITAEKIEYYLRTGKRLTDER